MQIGEYGSGVNSYPFSTNLLRIGDKPLPQNEKMEPDSQNTKELSQDEKAQISKLEQVDRNVKSHEAAHVAVGGSLVSGGANFQYTIGPDGKMYATGGEVSIDTSKGRTPEETISKMQRVQAAAMAPRDPSPQDYRVASSAAVMEARARAEQAKERSEESSNQKEANPYTDDGKNTKEPDSVNMVA